MSLEVMKQALAALEYEASKGNDNAYEKERVALRKAIEQAERQQALDKKAENARELGLDYEPVPWIENMTIDSTNELIKPTTPVQEPVAWMYDRAKYRENDMRGRQWAFKCVSQTKPYMDEMVRNVTPLYTVPQPKREFVSLTPDEIWEVYKKHDSLQYMAFARAIEQSLKEKNT